MADSKRKKGKEIPVTFGDNIRYIKGVTKYTTCTDVIKMVLRKLDDGKENGGPEAFGIYESSRGIERLLAGKCRLLKVMRSWGMDNNYELVFRKVNPGFAIPKISESKRRKLIRRRGVVSKSSTPAVKHSSGFCTRPNEIVRELYYSEDSESSTDELDRQKLVTADEVIMGGKLKKLSSVSTCNIDRNVTGQSDENSMVYTQGATSQTNINHVKYAVRKCLKSKSFKMSSSESSLEDACSTSKVNHRMPLESSNIVKKSVKEVTKTVKRHERLATEIVNKIGRLNHKEGKEAILQKYFADYITYRSPKYKYRDSRFRERGDGADSDEDVPDVSRRCTGASVVDTPVSRHQATARVLSVDEPDSDNEEDSVNFDTAFIGETDSAVDTDADNDETSELLNDLNNETSVLVHNLNNETYKVIDNLHECVNFDVIGKLVDYSLSEDDSMLSDPSDISKVSEQIHNVSSVSDIVKAVFDENISNGEDEEMESFMKTKTEHEFQDLSDEGLSSFGSNTEREILV